MRNVKRVTLGTLMLVLVLMVIAFVLENGQPMSLLFFGWSTPQLPVAVYITLALLLGMMIGPVLGWFVAQRMKRRLRHPA